LLRAADVTFAYRGAAAPVLRGVSLEVPANGFVGILGPNGSGKTTLLRVLAGTLPASSGRVTLDDVDVARVPRGHLARRMAVVPQETRLSFDFSALEIALMGRYPHLGTFEVEGPADVAIARAALAATGTGALADRAFTTLSGGEKQRVIIAAALAQISALGSDPVVNLPTGSNRAGSDPKYLLLDEPMVALDLAYQLEVAALLKDLQRRTPVAIAVSTHDLNFAAALCQSLVLLKEGRVLAAGPTADVLTPDLIAQLYGVRAEVTRHPGAGHLVVIPIARVDGGARA
jgi:ABC-type cobalamin/Fe3+-siderophores transport system ATPase subunit